MKRAAKIYTALIFVFLFAPIAILLVFSFNDAKSLSVFSGFSLKWYYELFRDAETLNALKNTLILAVIASIVSTVMGTAAAVGMNKLRSKYLRAALDTATDIPMMNPDIITGISLMLMFVFFGRLLGATTSLGFWSMLAAHITFCLPYVIMQVRRSCSRWTARCLRPQWTSAARRCALSSVWRCRRSCPASSPA